MGILFIKHLGFRRWIVFSFVGAIGIGVQMATLFTLTSGIHIGYMTATALSVEAAVLHNFFWHERWTWSDRIVGCHGKRLSRLLNFHLSNGALSMAGNLILMRILVGHLGFNYFYGNAIAIATCAMLNYVAGDRIVFRAAAPTIQRESVGMVKRPNRIVVCIFPLAVFVLIFGVVRVHAADLHPETVKAWLDCVEATERRIDSELSSKSGFLVLDFQIPLDSADERQAVLSGKTPVRSMATCNLSNQKIQVPDGMVHHWRGSVLIPGVPLDFVLSRISNPDLEDTRQEDVLDSRVLERSPGQLKLFLKLQRSKIVTVVYNTEHLVRYRHHQIGQASSSSLATKIAEIEHAPGNREQEKPQGHDSGFLWRMNSYWRYQQVPGGVIVECESMTLSRSIPAIFEFMVRPIINKIARESMERTLQSMRLRMTRAYRLQMRASQS
jgi:putative flippase GtrA